MLKAVQEYEREAIHDTSFALSERSNSLIMHKTPKSKKTPKNDRNTTAALNKTSDVKDPSKELFKQYMETRTRSRLVSVHQPIVMDMNFGVGVRKKLQGTEIEVEESESSKPRTLENESVLLKVDNDDEDY